MMKKIDPMMINKINQKNDKKSYVLSSSSTYVFETTRKLFTPILYYPNWNETDSANLTPTENQLPIPLTWLQLKTNRIPNCKPIEFR